MPRIFKVKFNNEWKSLLITTLLFSIYLRKDIYPTNQNRCGVRTIIYLIWFGFIFHFIPLFYLYIQNIYCIDCDLKRHCIILRLFKWFIFDFNVILPFRRKRLNISSTSSSPYAEIKFRQSEDSTYQQLNLSISSPKLDNTYQNLSLQ